MISHTADQALAQAQLYTDEIEYILVRFPPRAITAAAGVLAEIGEPFGVLIADKDEVTLVVPADAQADYIERLPDHVVSPQHYRLITFDIALDLSLVGFLALISAALAEAGVSIMAFAAYSRDHILVTTGEFDIAMAALEKLQSTKIRES
jgi:hypothetical protein